MGDRACQPEQRHFRAVNWYLEANSAAAASFRSAPEFAFDPPPSHRPVSLRMTGGFDDSRFDDILTTVLDALFSYAA